mgnify:CR=1 FL=1
MSDACRTRGGIAGRPGRFGPPVGAQRGAALDRRAALHAELLPGPIVARPALPAEPAALRLGRDGKHFDSDWYFGFWSFTTGYGFH